MPSRKSIVVSGDLGSGKSTVTSLLARHLGLRRVSMGDLHRAIAQDGTGMSALQLNVHAERDEAVDDRLDQLQAEMAKSNEQLIVDSPPCLVLLHICICCVPYNGPYCLAAPQSNVAPR